MCVRAYARAMKRVHEGLNNYIKSLKTAGDVAAPDLQPRLPVGPAAPLPIGLRPIPASSQAPKKTNATIVYARTAVNSASQDEYGAVRVTDVGGVAIPITEGSLVFTRRPTIEMREKKFTPTTKAPIGLNVKAFSLARVNHILQQEASDPEMGGDVNHPQRTHFEWTPDGVCNNLDGADPNYEFKDFAIANVAIQGFVRFSTLGIRQSTRGGTLEPAKIANTDRIFVALVEKGNQFQFELFTSHQITMQKTPFELDNIIEAWQIGRVVDGKQSKNMVTVNVSIDPVAPYPMPDAPRYPYLLVPNEQVAGEMKARWAQRYDVQQQLQRLWLDLKNKAILDDIQDEADAELRAQGGRPNVLGDV